MSDRAALIDNVLAYFINRYEDHLSLEQATEETRREFLEGDSKDFAKEDLRTIIREELDRPTEGWQGRLLAQRAEGWRDGYSEAWKAATATARKAVHKVLGDHPLMGKIDEELAEVERRRRQ